MPVNLSPVAGAAAQFLDNSGNVLTGGKLNTYAAGTTTPQATYTSGTGVTFHSNPIILDAAGRVPAGGEIWLTDGLQYKFVLTDANDVLIGTWDNLIGINSNFLNFYTQEEIQTATAGQTVFTLSTVTYTPGTNSISVFVDGVNQYDGSSYAYVETNSTTITFTAGLHVGALVKFTTAVSISAGATTADLVVYDPPFTGGVATTVEAKLAETVSVIDFGAVGDGIADNTTAIQNALNEGGIISFPAGTFIAGPLTLLSNTTLIFSPGTVLKAKTGFTQFQRFLQGSSISNVTIFGNKGQIEMLKSEYTTGEDRHGIAFFGGCSNISIYDLVVKDTGGDGFYVNGDNVSLVNCVSDNARRNGLSIIAGSNINIIGGEYKNTIGTNPQAGIDIEPDLSTEVLQNVNLIGVKTSNNARTGISFVPFNTTSPVSVKVVNCTSVNDGSLASLGAGHGMLFALSPAHTIAGEIIVENCTIETPKAAGVTFFNWTKNCPYVKLRNVNVINAGGEAVVSNVFNNGFGANSSVAINDNLGNFELINCSAKDTRSVPFMQVGCFLQTNFDGLENIYIENFEQFGQTSGYVSNVVFGNSFDVTNVKVVYAQETIISASATQNLNRDSWGNTFTNGGETSHTINLPVASNNVGMTLFFRVTAAGGFLRVIPNALDTILRYGSEVGISIVGVRIGDYFKLESLGNNQWLVSETTGQIHSLIGNAPSSYVRVSNGNSSAIPTTGTWSVGDIIYQATPVAGGNIGWVCVTAGTPGTWKSFGAIAS